MGNGASDAAAGSINLMFNFHSNQQRPLFVSPRRERCGAGS